MKKNNKVAILTGSEGFLGKFFFDELVKNNYTVFCLDKIKLKKKNYYEVNFNTLNKVNIVLNKIKEKIKKVDVLINCAAAQHFSSFENRSINEIYNMVNTNLIAPIVLSKFVFTNFFKKQLNGKIINIASMYGTIVPNFKLYSKGDRKSSETYGASKAGLVHLTKYFANYMSPYNVRVNSISPGGIFNKKVQNKKFIKKYSSINPSKRLAEPLEIVNVLNYLLDDKSNYFNGHDFVIDGGHSIKG
jgi:NAD(P)-dependent dehydrogenase (short-subunit alcohol dehydrogenase family)